MSKVVRKIFTIKFHQGSTNSYFQSYENSKHIISIGNELLIGDTVNTNASWLGQVSERAGF